MTARVRATLRPIGVIRSTLTSRKGAPRQGSEGAPDAWLAAGPFPPDGHPLERAGIRTDDSLRPLDGSGKVALDNVAIVGSELAGMRYLEERCGEGVAIASGIRAAEVLARALGGGIAVASSPRKRDRRAAAAAASQ